MLQHRIELLHGKDLSQTPFIAVSILLYRILGLRNAQNSAPCSVADSEMGKMHTDDAGDGVGDLGCGWLPQGQGGLHDGLKLALPQY